MKFEITHSNPNIDKKDIFWTSKVLRSGNISQGKFVNDFENQFSKFQNSDGSVAVNSGTAALHLSLLALGIKPKDEVIIPSFVCAALLNAVNYVCAIPKIVDVDYDTFNITVETIRKKLTKKTKAIIVPHMFGKSADITPILKLNIPVIEDCAQSIGALYKGKKVGEFGVLSIFSFYATKVMTTGEGGMVTSNNLKLIKRVRDLRDYDEKNEYKIRFNYKMTDFQGALGISQLKKLPEFIKKRKQIAEYYNENFRNKSLSAPRLNKDNIYYRYVVKSNNADSVIRKLNSKGICARKPIFKPLHKYLSKTKLPVSDKLFKDSISIPIYPNLSKQEIKYIVENVNKLK